jgi:hypothetical protein
MREHYIIIRESIFIQQPRQVVWDFTQDYSLRPLWDKTVMKAHLMEITPWRIAWLKIKGGAEMKLVYKVFHSPEKATVFAAEINSNLIEQAGGAWLYQVKDNGTIWQQTNALVFKRFFLISLMLPICKFIFRRQIRKAMKIAKEKLEQYRNSNLPDEVTPNFFKLF